MLEFTIPLSVICIYVFRIPLFSAPCSFYSFFLGYSTKDGEKRDRTKNLLFFSGKLQHETLRRRRVTHTTQFEGPIVSKRAKFNCLFLTLPYCTDQRNHAVSTNSNIHKILSFPSHCNKLCIDLQWQTYSSYLPTSFLNMELFKYIFHHLYPMHLGI